jgi:hypothetical protein
MRRTCPIRNRDGSVMPLSSTIAATVVPCWLAILLSVSPERTV